MEMARLTETSSVYFFDIINLLTARIIKATPAVFGRSAPALASKMPLYRSQEFPI